MLRQTIDAEILQLKTKKELVDIALEVRIDELKEVSWYGLLGNEYEKSMKFDEFFVNQRIENRDSLQYYVRPRKNAIQVDIYATYNDGKETEAPVWIFWINLTDEPTIKTSDAIVYAFSEEGCRCSDGMKEDVIEFIKAIIVYLSKYSDSAVIAERKVKTKKGKIVKRVMTVKRPKNFFPTKVFFEEQDFERIIPQKRRDRRIKNGETFITASLNQNSWLSGFCKLVSESKNTSKEGFFNSEKDLNERYPSVYRINTEENKFMQIQATKIENSSFVYQLDYYEDDSKESLMSVMVSIKNMKEDVFEIVYLDPKFGSINKLISEFACKIAATFKALMIYMRPWEYEEKEKVITEVKEITAFGVTQKVDNAQFTLGKKLSVLCK